MLSAREAVLVKKLPETNPSNLEELYRIVRKRSDKLHSQSVQSKFFYQLVGSITSLATVAGPTYFAWFSSRPEMITANTQYIVFALAILGALINLNNYFQWNKEYRLYALASLELQMLGYAIQESLQRLSAIEPTEKRAPFESQDLGKYLANYHSILKRLHTETRELVPLSS